MKLRIASAGGAPTELHFLARAAFGPGYADETRTHVVETRPDLNSGLWQPLPGVDPVQGRNLPVSVVVGTGFYRVREELKPVD